MPIGGAEQNPPARRAEIGIGDGQRQLADQRAKGKGPEPQTGEPQRIIGQAVRDQRHQPQHRDHAPAAALGARHQRGQPGRPGRFFQAGAPD